MKSTLNIILAKDLSPIDIFYELYITYRYMYTAFDSTYIPDDEICHTLPEIKEMKNWFTVN